MKTAFSFPDDLFCAAECHAKRVNISCSQLYADALRDSLARHAPDNVTAAMNQVVERLADSHPDPFVTTAARKKLAQTEW